MDCSLGGTKQSLLLVGCVLDDMMHDISGNQAPRENDSHRQLVSRYLRKGRLVEHSIVYKYKENQTRLSFA